MGYIGQGLRREEVRARISSSDWSDRVRRRGSADNGRTWSDWELVYEEAPEQGGCTQSGGAAVLSSTGAVVISATVPVAYRDAEVEKVPSVFPNDYRDACVAGAMCFVGRWDAARRDYDWTPSSPVFLPRRVSTRGLVELDLVELSDSRLLLLMRGSNSDLRAR